MLGIREYRFRARGLDDPTRIHDNHAVAETCNECEVMGDEQNGGPGGVAQLSKKSDDLILDSDVKSCRRLVRNQESGIVWRAPLRSFRAAASLPRTDVDRRGLSQPATESRHDGGGRSCGSGNEEPVPRF